jgi:hypothetical protein
MFAVGQHPQTRISIHRCYKRYWGRGLAGCLEWVILGVWDRGYARSCKRTSENFYSTTFVNTGKKRESRRLFYTPTFPLALPPVTGRYYACRGASLAVPVGAAPARPVIAPVVEVITLPHEHVAAGRRAVVAQRPVQGVSVSRRGHHSQHHKRCDNQRKNTLLHSIHLLSTLPGPH